MDLNQFKSPGVYTFVMDYWIPPSKFVIRKLKIAKIFNLTSKYVVLTSKTSKKGPSNQPVMVSSTDEFKKHFQ